MVPRAVLMKSGLVSVNTARQVNTAHSKTTVNAARPMSYLSKIAHSTVKRPIPKNIVFKNNNFNQMVNTIKDKNVNTVRPKAVVNTARPKAVVNVVKGNNVNAVKASTCWVWKPKTKVLDHGNPQIDLQDQGVIDSRCSRHMTGNMSYLTDYEEIDGGYIAFGGNSKGGKITRKCTIKTGSGPDWLFDIDALTRTMNYESIVADPKSSHDDGSKPLSDDGKKVNKDPRKDSECNDQEKEDNVNSTNNVNASGTNIRKNPKSVFLYGKIEEEVYVCQPPGFEDPDFPNRVYKVEKALYGLHQAPRAWYETLSTYLLDNGFQRGKINKTLFIKRHKGDILLVQVYVDDIILWFIQERAILHALEKLMHEKFQMSSMGELTFFLGLQKSKDCKHTNGNLKKPLLKDEDGEEVGPTSVNDWFIDVFTFQYHDIMVLNWPTKIGPLYPNRLLPFDLVAYTDNDYT
ncbi:putative ribonuclease H-like domain-containing protein [Tanacetum coccineum]